MPRRKNTSVKQKKQELQDKRAVKRGELSQSEIRNHQSFIAANPKARLQKSEGLLGSTGTKRLQSRFVTVSPEYLERTRILAHSHALTRPIPNESARFPIGLLERDEGKRLSCPARPKFRYDMTKKEVEKNEEGWFNKWLSSTESIIDDWIEGDDEVEEPEPEVEGYDVVEKKESWPRSTSWFETNLEVWRQLWRVSEVSSVILLLLDSRCPPLHCPPSLRTYIQNLKPRKEVILVLTKSDLVDPVALQGWRTWLKTWWGDDEVQIVAARSYDVEMLQEGKGRHRPDIPQESLLELVEALKTAHTRLSTPHGKVREDPEKLKNWQSPIRQAVDWSVLVPKGSARIMPKQPEGVDVSDEAPVEDPFTIGLVGQPNVGKSSLLNALLGEQRVRASKTPGKTMFWGWKKEVKIVDCPGLVCPSLVGLEIQALTGILPIAQIPSMPACIYYASTLIPLEQIYTIPRPEPIAEDPYASKKTWRGEKPAMKEDKEEWTAGLIMEGRALERGYITAKGGRPDGNRAANGIMRNLADGRIRWGFFPPDTEADRTGKGIWLGDSADIADDLSDDEVGKKRDDRQDSEEDDARSGASGSNIEEEGEEEEESDDDDEPAQTASARSFFAALDMATEEDSEEESEEEGTNGGDVEGAKDEDSRTPGS